MDWLNACLIDTPVVSAAGPQRHNDIGLVDCILMSIYSYFSFLLIVDITCLMVLSDCFLLQRKSLLLSVHFIIVRFIFLFCSFLFQVNVLPMMGFNHGYCFAYPGL